LENIQTIKTRPMHPRHQRQSRREYSNSTNTRAMRPRDPGESHLAKVFYEPQRCGTPPLDAVSGDTSVPPEHTHIIPHTHCSTQNTTEPQASHPHSQAEVTAATACIWTKVEFRKQPTKLLPRVVQVIVYYIYVG